FQAKKELGLAGGIAVNLGLLAWLQASYFVLFFLVYIVGTLALNLAWRTGWTGVAPPVIYQDEDEL
ncbi:MAG: CDP-diacylglycerol--serine O-phosphatidyltransferase, partial [Duganella sp.]